MCNLETEGIKYGCGHYVITRKVGKRDCNSPYCIHSSQHSPRCPNCPSCERYYGPDYKETIIKRCEEFCHHCAYWFEGPGSRPHPR